MELSEANQLLEMNPHPFEEGAQVLPSGIGLVAVRTPLPGIKGRMIDWWFGWLETTEQYKLWHPGDHIWSGWRGERGTGRYIGGTHLIHERIGTEKVHKLRLNFREPGTILDTSRFAAASVGAAVYGRGGPLHGPIWAVHVLHLVHDTDDGAVMRSRFWLGDVSPNIPFLASAIRRDMTSPEMMQGLQKHCREEMSNFATFLPELYRKHNPAAA